MDTPIVIPLPLNEPFAEVFVYGMCQSRTLWALFAEHVEVDAIPSRTAREAFKAARELAERMGGVGPGSWMAVLQQVREIHDRGQIALDDVFEVATMLHRAHTQQVPEDTIRATVTPILQERVRTNALDRLISGGDPKTTADLLTRAETIGESQTATVGLVDYAADLMTIASADKVATLPTPVIPLTAALGGGLCVGNLGAVTAHPAGGKSMYLNHQAAVSVCCGYFTGCLTAELARPHWTSRYIAALCGVEEKLLRRGDTTTQQAVMRAIAQLPNRGPITIDRFTAHSYTLQDLRNYIDASEQRVGEKMRTLVVDYADKLCVTGEPSEYKAMRVVYEGLREIAELRGMWVWTASQPQRGAGGGDANMDGIITQGELADSQHKLRALDTLVSINKRDEGRSRAWWIAKHRLDGGDQMIGPFPHVFAQGRVVGTPPMVAAVAKTGFSSWPEDVQVDVIAAELRP